MENIPFLFFFNGNNIIDEYFFVNQPLHAKCLISTFQHSKVWINLVWNNILQTNFYLRRYFSIYTSNKLVRKNEFSRHTCSHIQTRLVITTIRFNTTGLWQEKFLTTRPSGTSWNFSHANKSWLTVASIFVSKHEPQNRMVFLDFYETHSTQ